MVKKNLLLRLLKLRAIVNNKEIIELNHHEPAVIHFTETLTTIVISNGFHLSRTIELEYEAGKVYIYHIDCTLDDIRLYYGIFLTFFLFGMYILTSAREFMFVANLPILYMLYLFYIDRKGFIQVNAVGKI